MKTSHNINPFSALLVFLLSIGLVAAVSGLKMPISSASIEASAAAGTPLSLVAPKAIKPLINSSAAIEPVITWKELVSFLEKDHTNWNKYVPGKYTCLEFSMDLVVNARKQGIQAWIVTVDFTSGGPGHAFVGFKTSDRGTVYVEPQADDTYPLVKVGVPLCDAWGVYQCMGKVASIANVQCASANYCTKFTP